MPIAELFLGALLQVLLERLASRELLNSVQHKGIDMLLKKLERTLISISQVLDDAEARQLTGDLGVKKWLQELRNMAYDIEDLLDRFSTGCVEESDEMDDRLEKIITQKNNLSLRENIGQPSAFRPRDRPDSTTNLTKDHFFSREDDKKGILNLLTGEKNDRTCMDIKVISIVGSPGVGKTALAQEVYNDAIVTNNFDMKAWACVSNDFDVLGITKRILKTTNGLLSCEDKDLNWLQDKLKENLLGKKFLIVLDNVWNEKCGNWTTLLKPFQSGLKGSKIIITSCELQVAQIVGALPYTLKELSPNACMTLLAFHALGVGNFNCHPHLEESGRKIVEKCGRLPLAVKTLAGVLRTKGSRDEWEAILNSKIWDLSEERNEILPALKLSYLHLPSNLRRCFAYCAIFPKDYEIKRDELIQWWAAEDLLEGNKGMDRWNAGLHYFNELVDRLLFQKSSINLSRYLMHDLVNDLAKLAAGATYYSSREFKSEGDQTNASSARHVSFISDYRIMPEKFEIYHGLKRLRSFISLPKQLWNFEWSFVSKRVLGDLLLRLNYLRVLSLSHYHIHGLPDCIGDMRHLRHLNLAYTDIKDLPESIVKLHNLEVLILQGCHKLCYLPSNMERFNLRFLDISDTPSLTLSPHHWSILVGLEIPLCKDWSHCVGTEEVGVVFPRLEHLIFQDCPKSIGKLSSQLNSLVKLEINSCQHMDASPTIISLPSLHELNFGGCNVGVVKSLGYLTSLTTLIIKEVAELTCLNHGFTSSLIKLEKLEMKSCENLTYLWQDRDVIQDLACLKSLVITSCSELISLVAEEDIELPNNLEIIDLTDCLNLETLPSKMHTLSFLRGLTIDNCSHLVTFPETGIPTSMLSLCIINCNMLESLPIGLRIHLDEPNGDRYNHNDMMSCLQEIKISGCDSLPASPFSEDRFLPATLNKLEIWSCSGVESLTEIYLDGLQSLQVIDIWDCKNLKSLPQCLHILSHLTSLSLDNCPALELECFPPLPPGILHLRLQQCPKINFLPNQLLRLTCLQNLTIDGSARGLGEEDLLLPSSLLHLKILDMPKMKKLYNNLPPFLRTLRIERCPFLRELPHCGLPSSLEQLWIRNCEILERQCRGLLAWYRPTIQQIPQLILGANNESVY